MSNKSTNSTKNNNNKSFLTGEENTLGKNNQQKYKKLVYNEESDSEPELEESQYVPEETEKETEILKIDKIQPAQKRKNNIFEYINNDAKKNKRFFWVTLSLLTVMPVDLLLSTEQLLIIMTPKKKFKKLESSSKQVDMTKILPNISLAYSSLNFKECSKT